MAGINDSVAVNRTINIRAAEERDLADAYQIYYENETAHVSDPPPRPVVGDVPTDERHIFHSGKMLVAEQAGRLIAYTGTITRGDTSYLTDLFIDPHYQSAHLGSNLLSQILPDTGIRFTVSSTDFRAQALYIRSGMQPYYPNYNMFIYRAIPPALLAEDLEIIEANGVEPQILEWDTAISGRPREVDHHYWVREQKAQPLWFRKRGKIIGYGYVRLNAGTFWSPDSAWLGPLGIDNPEHAADCVLSAIDWAQRHNKARIRIDVPGHFVGLARLLEAGCYIGYQETFLSSASTPLFDARRYIPSGSTLY
ncbi:hypothetical protein ccbrp13_07750 [Ktedonobacteria bacterium brp13]|nr:hypothetical protein ccbrp13_07750 [Ktedonobacteria bacterium brp13]